MFGKSKNNHDLSKQLTLFLKKTIETIINYLPLYIYMRTPDTLDSKVLYKTNERYITDSEFLYKIKEKYIISRGYDYLLFIILILSTISNIIFCLMFFQKISIDDKCDRNDFYDKSIEDIKDLRIYFISCSKDTYYLSIGLNWFCVIANVYLFYEFYYHWSYKKFFTNPIIFIILYLLTIFWVRVGIYFNNVYILKNMLITKASK